MDRNIIKVLRGYTELPFSERTQIMKFFIEYEQQTPIEKTNTKKELNKSIGPLSDPCPCCGK